MRTLGIIAAAAVVLVLAFGWPPAFLARGSFTDGMLERLNAATVACPPQADALGRLYDDLRCAIVGGDPSEARGRIDDAARGLGGDPLMPWDFDGDDLYSRMYDRNGSSYVTVLSTWRTGENILIVGKTGL